MESMVTFGLLIRKQVADITDSVTEAMWTVGVGHGAFGEER